MSDDTHSTPVRLKSLSEKLSVMDLLDPRSPTTAFQRTPIQVILENSRRVSAGKCSDEVSSRSASASFVSLSTPQMIEDESLELSASSTSFLSLENLSDIDSIDLSSDDLSIMVSDFSSSKEEIEKESPCVMSSENDGSVESSVPSREEEIVKECPRVMNHEVDRSVEETSIQSEFIAEEKIALITSNVITPVKSNSEGKSTTTNPSSRDDSSNDSLLESAVLIRKKPLKNMFYTPNPNKKRNPLGTVDNTCPTTPPSHLPLGSPQNVFCEKQWKRIQEERKKLGLEADENAQLPLHDITASAPSKLIRKSRLRTRYNGVMS